MSSAERAPVTGTRVSGTAAKCGRQTMYSNATTRLPLPALSLNPFNRGRTMLVSRNSKNNYLSSPVKALYLRVSPVLSQALAVLAGVRENSINALCVEMLTQALCLPEPSEIYRYLIDGQANLKPKRDKARYRTVFLRVPVEVHTNLTITADKLGTSLNLVASEVLTESIKRGKGFGSSLFPDYFNAENPLLEAALAKLKGAA